MRLKKASLTFAGAAAAVAVTTMAASPAWACNDSDPALKLTSLCGATGQPNWMLSNPNGWGHVPATWTDNEGGHSDGMIDVPPNGTVTLPTHATKVTVIAYRPDLQGKPPWKNHGAFGVLLHACKKPKPPAPPATAKPKPKPKPTTEAPKPSAPSGEAKPATPVKAQPAFTG